MRSLALIAPLFAAACAHAPPVHELGGPLPEGEWAWCMAPNGEVVGWTSSPGEAAGTHGICASPARFVLVPVCREGQVPPDESAEARAARVRLARDGTLHGDGLNGRPFCAPVPPS